MAKRKPAPKPKPAKREPDQRLELLVYPVYGEVGVVRDHVRRRDYTVPDLASAISLATLIREDFPAVDEFYNFRPLGTFRAFQGVEPIVKEWL